MLAKPASYRDSMINFIPFYDVIKVLPFAPNGKTKNVQNANDGYNMLITTKGSIDTSFTHIDVVLYDFELLLVASETYLTAITHCGRRS